MIRGIIFDADGTLLDSMHIWQETGTRYLQRLNIRAEENLAEILFSMSLEEGCAYLKEHYALSETVTDIKAGVIGVIADFYQREVVLKNGVLAFLSALQQKNVPMVLATSGDKELLSVALKRLGVWGCFTGVLTCSEHQTGKRDAKIYRLAADLLGTKPSETVVFEDVLFALKTAKQAGFTTVAVWDAASQNDWEELRKTADFCMTDFSDFSAFWHWAERSV